MTCVLRKNLGNREERVEYVTATGSTSVDLNQFFQTRSRNSTVRMRLQEVSQKTPHSATPSKPPIQRLYHGDSGERQTHVFRSGVGVLSSPWPVASEWCRARKPSLAAERVAELRKRVHSGEKKAGQAWEFGISRETLYQYLHA